MMMFIILQAISLLIILLKQKMSIPNFKNLIKPSLFSDDSFQPLLKKSDEYRKNTQIALVHFQLIVKNFQQFQSSHEKILVEYEEFIDNNYIDIPQYYQKYIQLYRNIWSEYNSFDQKLGNNMKELASLCDGLFTNFSKRILTFQGYIRAYKAHQLVLGELSKKYFRTHKAMLVSIDSYKETFTDVKIIYNMGEKTRRYSTCENNYKALHEQLQNLDKKVAQLSQQKTQIIQAYKDIDKELILTMKAVGGKLIGISKSFINDFCFMEKRVIAYLAEKKFSLQQLQLKSFFSAETKINLKEYFNVQINPKEIEIYPAIVVYHKHIKEEYYFHLDKLLLATIKQNDQKIDARKKLNKKVLDLTTNYVKNYQKGFYFGLKDININFQKIKKGLSDMFGSKLCSFLKSIHSIFQLSIGINQKCIKRTLSKFKSLQQLLLEESTILDLFKKQFKNNIDNILHTKSLKKIISQKQINQFTEEEVCGQDVTAFKKSMAGKAEHLSILIDGFVQKFKKNYDQIKFQYNAVINDLSISTNEFYSLCCQYQEMYFGEDQYVKNFKKYQIDIDATLQLQRKFFQEINFGCLLKDQPGKIIFDSQIHKIQEYKKLKKPTSINIDEVEKSPIRKKSDNAEESGLDAKKVDEGKKIEEIKGEKKDNLSKHEQFLASKIDFLPGEKFVKSFSCALSDSILLSGRVYLTNKRICFASSFNPSNVFFGGTFLQIPKQDIKKIEKKMNAFVFDNSISITTVNGQVFLTSFFSRNQAFDLIMQTMELDIDECMFEPEEIKEVKEEEVVELTHADDLKEDQESKRQESIKEMLSKWNYKELIQSQFSYQGFSAFKFLKLFEVGGEFAFNRKTYNNFAVYIKECLEHRDYEYSDWAPSRPFDFLNTSNIKASTPLKFIRKINCLVPVANSGVPFMPKQAKSQQTQTLFIISKNKYILESVIQNSGVPYAETFNLRILKVVETLDQNTCRLTVSLFINFITTPLIKHIIQSKSFEETKTAFCRTEAEAKKYFVYLQKLRMKSRPSPAAHGDIVSNNNEEYEKQIGELRDSQDKLKAELKAANEKFQEGKKIFLGSLVLNILLILILIS